MTPADTRNAVIDAIRRDLVGPLADPDGTYPGATPVQLNRGQRLDTPKELAQLFVAADGQEVLTTPPTSRYIVGALYPVLREEEEQQLDADQAPATAANGNVPAEDAAELTVAPTVVADALTDATDGDPAAGDEDQPGVADVVHDRPGRPSAFSVSFVITDQVRTLRLQVTGARYEPYPFELKTDAWTGWHRIPADIPVAVDLPADGSAALTRRRLDDAPLRLEVGVTARAVAGGQRIVTCHLVNRTPATGPHPAERALFGAQLAVAVPAGQLADYPDHSIDRSPEADTLQLLYEATPVRAVGHGVDAVASTVTDEHGATWDVVRTSSLPAVEVTGTTPDIADEHGSLAVSMDALADWHPDAVATVERILTGYRAWIAEADKLAADLTGRAQATALRHLQACRSFADDVEAGWALTSTPGPVHQCLRWTSQAMAAQRRSYAADTRAITVDGDRVAFDAPGPAAKAAWRPFQLAFLLANLGQVSNPQHPRRGVVDVIWMPTGGGKTEAYLGLAAFTMLYRRLTGGAAGAGGTAVIMRYTLRLLTAQQLQRAASLICALEVIRLDHTTELGTARFSIGAWLGKASTPNWRKDALAELGRLAGNKPRARRPFLLSRCPACAAAMGDVVDGRVLGYDSQALCRGVTRMRASCPDPACRFHRDRTPAGLPVYEVDEDVYAKPPTFLVATVDKFAQLAWNERARVLFGLDGRTSERVTRAPELIIQDELHLISGPLGSLVGLYEAAIDQLCRHDGGLAPHVVAATATTRAYASQAAALYACDSEQVRLVPPPGLTISDSFFARADTTNPPRVFLGVCATGSGRFTRTQMRVSASLAHAAAVLEQTGAEVDPWWTNVTFFGSLRDLGQAKALNATDLRGYSWQLVRATGLRTGLIRTTGAHAGERRAMRTLADIELTGSSSDAASEALERLARSRGQAGCVDLALATSVIEVGVDVDRLGLLTVVRQPKTAAQYIQVAGRVGRDPRKGPGLVVSLLNPSSSRDMSHYERFTPVHGRLYAAVEPASVTPFTDAALDRGLRGALAAVIRQTRRTDIAAVTDDDVELARLAAAAVADRAGALGGDAKRNRVRELAGTAVYEIAAAAADQLQWGSAGRSGVQFLRPLEDPPPPDRASWPVLTSLRSVDADAALRIDENWLPATTVTPPADTSSPTEAGQEDAW